MGFAKINDRSYNRTIDCCCSYAIARLLSYLIPDIVYCCIISYRIVSYFVSYSVASYRTVSYNIVSYRIVSYRIASHRIVSSHSGKMARYPGKRGKQGQATASDASPGRFRPADNPSRINDSPFLFSFFFYRRFYRRINQVNTRTRRTTH